MSDHPESRKSSQSENHVSNKPETMKPSSDKSSSTVDTSKMEDIPDNAALEKEKKAAKENYKFLVPLLLKLQFYVNTYFSCKICIVKYL